MSQNEIFVIDIETVPDAEATRRLLRDARLADEEAGDALRAYFLEKTNGKSDFSRQPFHRVVAIGYAQLARERAEDGGAEFVLKHIACGGRPEDDERTLLAGFFGMIEKRTPQLVTFNGRTFDLPVLKLRAMAHGLSCPGWFSTGDRWESYDARFGNRFHLDLQEVLSDYGAAARCSLDEIAAAFGVPGKFDTSGADVEQMVQQGNIEDVRAYCELDVCTTLLVFLRWAHFTGELKENAYARAIEGLGAYLADQAETRPHLGRFLEAWQAMQR